MRLCRPAGVFRPSCAHQLRNPGVRAGPPAFAVVPYAAWAAQMDSGDLPRARGRRLGVKGLSPLVTTRRGRAGSPREDAVGPRRGALVDTRAMRAAQE